MSDERDSTRAPDLSDEEENVRQDGFLARAMAGYERWKRSNVADAQAFNLPQLPPASSMASDDPVECSFQVVPGNIIADIQATGRAHQTTPAQETSKTDLEVEQSARQTMQVRHMLDADLEPERPECTQLLTRDRNTGIQQGGNVKRRVRDRAPQAQEDSTTGPVSKKAKNGPDETPRNAGRKPAVSQQSGPAIPRDSSGTTSKTNNQKRHGSQPSRSGTSALRPHIFQEGITAADLTQEEYEAVNLKGQRVAGLPNLLPTAPSQTSAQPVYPPRRPSPALRQHYPEPQQYQHQYGSQQAALRVSASPQPVMASQHQSPTTPHGMMQPRLQTRLQRLPSQNVAQNLRPVHQVLYMPQANVQLSAGPHATMQVQQLPAPQAQFWPSQQKQQPPPSHQQVTSQIPTAGQRAMSPRFPSAGPQQYPQPEMMRRQLAPEPLIMAQSQYQSQQTSGQIPMPLHEGMALQYTPAPQQYVQLGMQQPIQINGSQPQQSPLGQLAIAFGQIPMTAPSPVQPQPPPPIPQQQMPEKIMYQQPAQQPQNEGGKAAFDFAGFDIDDYVDGDDFENADNDFETADQ